MPAGRKTDLTPAVQATIVTHIRAGNYAVIAAQAAGISEPTYYEWLSRGEGKNKNRPQNALYAAFAEAIRDAEAAAEAEVADRTYKKLRSADATIADELKYLAARYPDRWGRSRVDQNVTGDLNVSFRETIASAPNSDETE